jgi:hypothetical protein
MTLESLRLVCRFSKELAMNVDDDSVPFGSHELVWFQIVKSDFVYLRVKGANPAEEKSG